MTAWEMRPVVTLLSWLRFSSVEGSAGEEVPPPVTKTYFDTGHILRGFFSCYRKNGHEATSCTRPAPGGEGAAAVYGRLAGVSRASHRRRRRRCGPPPQSRRIATDRRGARRPGERCAPEMSPTVAPHPHAAPTARASDRQ